MKEFKDKVAVITGAASGIGLGISKRCIGEGVKVVLADIEEAALSQAEKTLKTAGVKRCWESVRMCQNRIKSKHWPNKPLMP